MHGTDASRIDDELRDAYRAGRRDAWRVTVGIVVALCWFGTLALGLAYAAYLVLMGDAVCEPFPGGSTYGTLGWSVLPPGPTCTFTEQLHGFDEVRGPTPVMSIWLLVLLVAGVAIALVGWRRMFPPAPRWGDDAESPW